ncbi:MAG: hypothetical protein FJ405_12485 [Verrucomicrobia bacterium]|nr:hypothetical protein [Verrucomicrobiota bacterium]
MKEATPGGAAAAAGLRVGDTLTSVGEAPIISAADIAWALHRLGDKGTLVLGGTRNGEAKTWTLELEDGWRFRSDISRRVGTWGLRGMVLGGLLLRSMPEDRLKALGLPEDSLGLEVEMAGEYGIHAASRKAGFRKGDILGSVEGLKGRMTESELIGRLLISHPGKGSLTTTVARGEARLSLQLPLQ